MSVDIRSAELANYQALVKKIDQLCTAVNSEFAAAITCRAGCSGCCRELTLFPVEAAALLGALAELSPRQAEQLIDSAARATDGSCPLLVGGLCLIYAGRPIICRTHGLPLLVTLDGQSRVDFCPENFRGVATLPGQAVINLELLNQALVVINALYVENSSATILNGGQRLSIALIITIWKGIARDDADAAATASSRLEAKDAG